MSAQVLRRKDASRNRVKIVDAFSDALSRGEQITLDEVARRAGVGIATLYRHFPNRDALQQAAFETVIHDEVVPLMTRLADHDPRTGFIEAGLGLVEVIARRRSPDDPPLDLAAVAAEMDDDLREPLAALFAEGQEVGAIRPDLDFVDGLWVLQLLSAGFSVPSATPDVRRRYLSLIFDALSTGPKATLPPLNSPT